MIDFTGETSKTNNTRSIDRHVSIFRSDRESQLKFLGQCAGQLLWFGILNNRHVSIFRSDKESQLKFLGQCAGQLLWYDEEK